jgi:predicted DNA-binding transcriptional regulator YafY
VRIRYRRPDGAITDRTIEPGFLHWDGAIEAMYVPSWCHLRNAIRVFAVHRILSIDPVPEASSRSVPSRRAMERVFRVWYRDKIEHVQVLFTAQVAPEIRERRWHASQRIVDGPDAGVYLHLDVSAPEELERWLLGFGPHARVIEPTLLADQIQRAHAQAAGVGQVIDAGEPRRSRPPSAEPIAAGPSATARRRR